MAQHLETGKEGEDKASEFLAGKGYEIMARNYRHRHAEIDIIAKKAKMLIFVEVKTRRNLSYGFPEDFVDYAKTRLIMKAAENYIFEIDWQQDIRFDIVSVIINQNETRIKHIEDAFS